MLLAKYEDNIGAIQGVHVASDIERFVQDKAKGDGINGSTRFE